MNINLIFNLKFFSFMRIRWKFLIVLLSISLIPMIVMRLNGQQAMRELGNELATQTKNALVTETKVALKRLVEDHARILKRERELLEMTLLLVSSEIQKRLYNLHDNSLLEAAPFFPTQTMPLHEHNDKEMYCLLKPQGQCLPLQMSFMNQRFYINTLSDPDNDKILDMIHRLAAMSPLNLAIKNKHPELIIWQHIFMENGLRMIYPDPGLSTMIKFWI
jgi:phosphoserine phosphatase RsbU/P